MADQLNSVTSHVQVSRRGALKTAAEQTPAQNSVDDDPGTIAAVRRVS